MKRKAIIFILSGVMSMQIFSPTIMTFANTQTEVKQVTESNERSVKQEYPNKISLLGVVYNNTKNQAGVQIKFDNVNKRINAINLLDNNSLHPGFSGQNYIKVELYNKQGTKKAGFTANGEHKLNTLAGFNTFKNASFEFGDVLKIYHAEPGNRTRISGQVINQKGNFNNSMSDDNLYNSIFEITENGLKQIYKANPTITAKDMVTLIGDSVSVLDGITAKDDFNNNLTSNVKVLNENAFNPDALGSYTIQYRVTDSWGRQTTASRKITVVDMIATDAKLTYAKNYGIIFEGEARNVKGETFDSSVKKKLIIKDNNSKVLKEIDLLNTDWYQAGNYSGFQGVLSINDLRSLGNIENANIYIKIEYKGKTSEVLYKDTNSSKAENVAAITASTEEGWTSNFYNNMAAMPEIKFSKESIKIGVNSDGNVTITTNVQSSLNEISKYMLDNKLVFDGIIDSPFDISANKKIFEVKNQGGRIVYTGNVAVFADTAYPEYKPGSVIQLIVPEGYSNSNYTVDVVIKDSSDVEVARFNIDPHM